MSFGGSVQAMIVSLKNNARNRISLFKKSKNENDIIHIKKNTLTYKTPTTSDLEQIKIDIRIKAKKESKRQKLLAVVIITPILITIFLMVSYKIDHYPENKRLKDSKYKKMISTEKKINYILKEGGSFVNSGNYKQAKTVFFKGHQLKPKDFRINFATANTYVLDCIENEKECDTAAMLVAELKKEYGDNSQITHLEFLINQK